jgi:hypothetical protein
MSRCFFSKAARPEAPRSGSHRGEGGPVSGQASDVIYRTDNFTVPGSNFDDQENSANDRCRTTYSGCGLAGTGTRDDRRPGAYCSRNRDRGDGNLPGAQEVKQSFVSICDGPSGVRDFRGAARPFLCGAPHDAHRDDASFRHHSYVPETIQQRSCRC